MGQKDAGGELTFISYVLSAMHDHHSSIIIMFFRAAGLTVNAVDAPRVEARHVVGANVRNVRVLVHPRTVPPPERTARGKGGGDEG